MERNKSQDWGAEPPLKRYHTFEIQSHMEWRLTPMYHIGTTDSKYFEDEGYTTDNVNLPGKLPHFETRQQKNYTP
jgi:hypothetical protein